MPTLSAECGVTVQSLTLPGILDEPGQTLARPTRINVSIPFPTKKVDRLVVRPRQSSVEVVERFQVVVRRPSG